MSYALLCGVIVAAALMSTRRALADGQSEIAGRVGGDFLGTDVRVTVAGDTITGRIGGRTVGWDVRLTVDARGYVDGRFEGTVGGNILSGSLTANSFKGRIGGKMTGNTLHINMEDGRITGRVGGDFIGFNLDLQHDAEGQVVSGRIGGKINGEMVSLRLGGDADPMLAAMLAAVTVYYIRRQAARVSAGVPRG